MDQLNSALRSPNVYQLISAVSPAIQPPFDLVMPATAQTVWEMISAAILLYTLYYFARQSRKEQSWFPMLFWLGTIPLTFAEPLFDVGMTCFYPHVGQHAVFELFGRSMPLFLVFCYLGGIAPVMYAVALRIEQGAGTAFIWKVFVIMGAGTAVYEIITINLGLWTYYSPAHPLRVFNYPLGIGIENGAAFLLTAFAVVKIRPMLKGGQQWLAALILPIVFVMGEFAAGWPYFSVINTEAAIESRALGFAGLFGTLFFAVAIVWWITIAAGASAVRLEREQSTVPSLTPARELQ